MATATTAAPHGGVAGCDESCLLGIAGAYMDSLSANDPAGAPFDQNLRSTENGVLTPVRAGIWASARGWTYRHTVVDPLAGEIGAFGSIREDGTDALIAVRLKVVDRRITESELLVARKGDFALFDPAYAVEPAPIFTAFVPPERRASRAELAAIPHRYFEAIMKGDPTLVAVHPDANRVEDGVATTNNPALNFPSLAESLSRLIYMQHVRQMRIPVVDPARGLVWMVAVVDMPEMTRTLTIRGRPVEINPQKQHLPRTLFLCELFKVEDGRIRQIEAVMRNMPLGADVGWSAP